MMDIGPPSTTTSKTVTETHVQTNLRWDPSYLKTIPGMLKVAAVALNLIGFVCVMCSGAYSRSTSTGEFFSFVAMVGFWMTGTLLLFYLLHVMEKFHVIPWLLIEFVFCGVWAFFYFATSIDVSVQASYGVKSFGAAGFFGFCACAVYGYDCFLKFQGWRANQLAQGERTVQSSTAEVVSPNF